MSNVSFRKSQRESADLCCSYLQFRNTSSFHSVLRCFCEHHACCRSHFHSLQCPFLSPSPPADTTNFPPLLFIRFFWKLIYFTIFCGLVSHYHKNNVAGTSVTCTATSLSLELCGCRSRFYSILSLTFRKTHLSVFII